MSMESTASESIQKQLNATKKLNTPKELYATDRLLRRRQTPDPLSARFFLTQCETAGVEPHNSIFAHHFTSDSNKKRINQEFFEDIAPLRWILLYISAASSSGHIRVDKSIFLTEMIFLFKSPTADINSQVKEQLILAEKQLNQGDIISHHPSLFGKITDQNPESTLNSNLPETPIILSRDNNFFYTNKLYRLEDQFLKLLSERCKAVNSPSNISEERISAISKKVIEQGSLSSETDIILDAAKKAIHYPLLAISGGPGTGKTTMVTYLLKILKEVSTEIGETLRVALCAPTGRAASRIKESIQNQFSDSEHISQEAYTLHKLLKIRQGSPTPYREENPLPFDLVIVDEASMIDLIMMKTLFGALSPHTTLILVGDKDQLPSVDTGALLADILYKHEDPKQKLHQRVVILKTVFRSEKTILGLAQNVITGNEKETISLLRQSEKNNSPSIGWHDLSGEKSLRVFYKLLSSITSEQVKENEKTRIPFECSIEKREEVKELIDQAFRNSEKTIILSPLKRGPYGTEMINQMIDISYASSQKRTTGCDNPTGLYHLKEIMITRNDYKLGLYNGDRGIICQFQKSYYAFFRGGLDEKGNETYKHYPLSNLTHYESANAITIHKSQGSEWEKVYIVLPIEASKLLKREMFYTALTRAKKRVVVYSTEEAITQTVTNRVIRNSGVREFVLN